MDKSDKRSIELVNEDIEMSTITPEANDFEIEVVYSPTKWQKAKTHLQKPTSLCILISMTVLISSFLSRYSCSGDKFCFPQYSVHISLTSNIMVISIREGLKMLSYMAKDLSIEQDKELQYVIVDTLSTSNKFRFNFGGYCRQNIETNDQRCVRFKYGMDFFKVLINDMGEQLSLITKTKDPAKFVNSIMLMYGNFAKTMAQKSVAKVENGTFILRVLNDAVIIITVILLVCFAMLHRRRVIYVVLLQLLVLISLLGFEIYYIHRISFNLSSMAEIGYGGGFYFVIMNVVLCAGQLGWIAHKNRIHL